MERREFLKIALGFAAAVGSIATITAAQAASAHPNIDGDAVPKPGEMEPRSSEVAADATQSDKIEAADTDFSAHRRRRRWTRRRWRRRYWRPRYYARRRWRRRRRWWRRPHVIYRYYW